MGFAQGVVNASNASNNPDLKQLQSLFVDMDSYFREINGRSPNATQLSTIGPTLIPNIGGSYHFGYKADSLSVANHKLDMFEQRIKGMWGGQSTGPSDSDIESGIESEITH